MIQVKNVTKKYGNVTALNDVTFEIKQGEIVGLLGPNGAGKTTTLKIITCFISATTGEASVGNYDCFTNSVEVRKKIGYLPENNPLYEELNVFEYLYFAAEMHGMKKDKIKKALQSVVKSCGLQEKVYTSISELSKGFKQRVGLAAAMIHDPDVLILDEPTTGLDPNQVIEIRSLIKEIGKKKTIILSTHILSEVEATCSRVIIINNGKIVATGTPSELMAKKQGKGQILSVTFKATKNDAEKVLKNISDITHAKLLDTDTNEYVSFELHASEDISEKLFDETVRAKLKLVEISKSKVTLEDVFTTLTK
jgi:ABC-2 type transport system ATP-binding protein